MTIQSRSRIDALGLFCPVPLQLLKKAVNDADPGDVIEIFGDDPQMSDDIGQWIDIQPHELVENSRDGKVLTFYIRKSTADTNG